METTLPSLASHAAPGADPALVRTVDALVDEGVRCGRWRRAEDASSAAVVLGAGRWTAAGGPEPARGGTRVEVVPDAMAEDAPAGVVTVPAAVLSATLVRTLLDAAVERAALLETIDDEEARYAFLLEAADLGDWDMDVRRNRTRRSLRHDQLFGHDAMLPTWGYDDFLAHVHPEDRAMVDAAYRRALAGGGDYNVEFRAPQPDGSTRWLWSRGRFVLDAEGRPLRAAGVMADITARKLAEERLRAVAREETLGKLAAGLAHDFNNLLTVILGSADFLATEPELQASLRPVVDDIRGAGTRSAAIVRRLLGMAHMELGRHEVLDLRTLLADLAPAVTRLMGEAVRTTVTLPDGAVLVRGDARDVEQVVLNLAANARDAMPQGGALRVALTVDDGQARLTVADTGAGMDAATRARCFDPFYTTKPRGRGTGLGLASARATVTGMGGTIDVASAPGAGTTFSLALPLAPAGAAPVRIVPAAEMRRARGERVLLVDDDAGVREIARRTLVDAGYEVLTAASGEEAVRLSLDAGRLDALVTDVVMPTMSGRALAEAVLARSPETRVLLMSGYSDDEVARYGVERGRWSFLAKPFAPGELRARVAELLTAAAAA